MVEKFPIQVSSEHYFNHYDDLNRFVSYFYQVDTIRKLKIKNILEIGIGNKTLTAYLQNHGYTVTTCDFDASLKPDYVADIRRLPFKKPQFEGVIAFEILEHIPFTDFALSLQQLHQVTTKYVVISLPYSGIYLELLLRFPFIAKIIKKPFMRLFLSVPFFSRSFLGPEHYWELGRRGYSRRKVRTMMRTYFKIRDEFRPPLSPHHCFFVLEKKE